MKTHDIKNISLAEEGKKRIEWAIKEMPVLKTLREDYRKKKPLKGEILSACLHVTAETAHLMIALKEAGAEVFLCASNPLSTQDDVAASLVKHYGISVFAIKGEDTKTYMKHVDEVLDKKPTIVMDDGADLVSELHKKRVAQAKILKGSTEETTTGVIRLKALSDSGKLLFPVVAVNESKTKHMFDNRYGTGQSTLDGIIRATNKLVAGSTFVVAGYGWCGKGLASRARGLGAKVIVTEIDPIKALEARMDGFEVMPMSKAVTSADFVVTVTGNKEVVSVDHFKKMKDGCVVSNSGHFDVEIDMKGLRQISKKVSLVRNNVEKYELPSGKNIYVVGEGRLVNLAAAEGHPSSVMDMSFANQSLAAIFIKENHGKLSSTVYTLPHKIDEKIASEKLKTLGISIDKLTPSQKKYLGSWEEGTE